MQERERTQLVSASASAETPPFSVKIVRQADGSPSIIVCDGIGEGCPFKVLFKGAWTCDLDIESNEGDHLCGNAILNDIV